MLRALQAIVLATLLQLSGCAHTLNPDDALAVVPYSLERDGRFVVGVELDYRGPFDFVVDSAATISMVTGEPLDELQLPLVPGRTVMIHGMVGSDEVSLYDVESLRMGDETWSNAVLAHIPEETNATARIDGILGVDFLSRYGVGFAAGERVLRLYAPHILARRAYRGWTSIPLEPRVVGGSRQPLYFLKIRIGSRELSALLDIGSGENIINSAAARFLNVIPLGLNGFTILSGPLTGVEVRARFASPVVAEDVRWRNRTFLIADVEIFETLEHGDTPLAIMGASFFNDRDFVIDFTRDRLLVRDSRTDVDRPGQRVPGQ